MRQNMNVLARDLVQKTLFSISLAVALRKYRHFIAKGLHSTEAKLFGGALANSKIIFIPSMLLM